MEPPPEPQGMEVVREEEPGKTVLAFEIKPAEVGGTCIPHITSPCFV